MWWVLESAALAAIAIFALMRSRREDRPAGFLLRFALVCAAGWLSEQTCIALYHFYAYSPKWHFFAGQVPLVVILAWPAVILSGRDLAAQLMGQGHRLLPWAAAALVGSDAALIEPVAVGAGLWNWNEPGFFGVPPIAILGWTFFALGCHLLLGKSGEGRVSLRQGLALLILPALGAHALLLAAWWGALRWVSLPMPSALAAAAVWTVSLTLVWLAARTGAGHRLNPRVLWLRLPAAILVYALLFFAAGAPLLLTLYALAFIPPYLLILGQGCLGRKGNTQQLPFP